MFDQLPDGKPVRCIFIGDEVLVAQCVEQGLAAGLDVAAVLTTNPTVAARCGDLGVRCLDSSADLELPLRDLEFDALLTIGFLRLLSDEVRQMAEIAINFHDGPLPAYAGLNVTSWALLDAQVEHAVTWHLIGSGVDDGDVVLTQTFPIEPNETAYSLNARCYEAALSTFPQIAEWLAQWQVPATPQPAGQRRVFRRHERPAAATLFDPHRPAAATVRVSRALDVGARQKQTLGSLRLVAGDKTYLITSCEDVEASGAHQPGRVSVDPAGHLRVATSDGDLVISGLTDTNGSTVDPAEVIAVLDRESGGVLGSPPPNLIDRLTELDPAIAAAEGRMATALSRHQPSVLSSAGPAATDSNWATVETTMPATWRDDQVIAVLAAWLARRTGRDDAVFGFTDQRLRGELGDLAPLARPPMAHLELTTSTTLSELVQVVAGLRERIDQDGLWLADLVARDPTLRVAPPDRPQVMVELGECRSVVAAGGVIRFVVDGGRVRIDHRLDVFDSCQAEKFSAEIETLAYAAADLTDSPLRELPMLSGPDRSLFDDVNSTSGPVDDRLTVDMLFRRQVERTPDAPALSFGPETLTYAELSVRVARLAGELAAAGVGPGSRVGIAVPRSIEMVVSVLAVLDRGAAYVPLDPTYPTERLAFMIADADLLALVAPREIAGRLGSPRLSIIDPGRILDRVFTADRQHNGSDLAYVIYTSGSTGKPKGVMVEHRNLTNFFSAMDEIIHHDPPGVWLAVTSLSFDISVLELLWTLTRGFHVVLNPDNQHVRRPAAEQRAPLGERAPRFSLFYFAADDATGPDAYRLLLDGARFADRQGFEAVWVPERHFHEFGGIYPNPAVAAAAIAATTEKIQIRAGSVVVPLHHPARVAEEWAVVDNLSRGRVGIAAAAGWQPDDFVLQPQNHHRAKQAMAESLDQIQRLWRGESVEMQGPNGPVQIRTLPRPVQPQLPVWITSAGNTETFELAGRDGHNLLTHLLGQSIEQVAEKIAAYRQARTDAGHHGEGHVTLMLHTFVAEDREVAIAEARPHLKEYLRSATGLLKDVASSFPTLRDAGENADEIFANLTEEEMEDLLDMAVERYVGSSGLFGDLDDAMTMVDQIAAIGVDEIACLIDFGIDTDLVLDSLPLLSRLKDRAAGELGSRDEPRPSDPSAAPVPTLAELIHSHGCTHLQCTPSLAAMAVADPSDREAIGHLHHLLVGGEALPAGLAGDLRDLLSGRLTNMYGPTETTIWSLTHELDDVKDTTVPIGRPISNTTVAVLDSFGSPVPVGVLGELHIGGAGVARGYHDRADLDAERFVDRPGLGRMYATGDMVRMLPSGVVEYAGRADFQVKIRGHRIELGEIESILDDHPEVMRSVVSARDTKSGPQLAAYFVSRPGSTVSDDCLRDHVARALPEIMVPAVFVSLDELPLTPNGKVDRNALPEPGPSIRASPAGPEPSLDQRESIVADLWASVLGHPVGRDDNFFDVGGHSLLAVEVYRRLTETTGAELALTDIFRYPTVRTLAGQLPLDHADPDTKPDDARSRSGGERGAMRRRALQRRGVS